MIKKGLIAFCGVIAAIAMLAGVFTAKPAVVSASTTYTTFEENFDASESFGEAWTSTGSAVVGVDNDVYLSFALANACSVATKDQITVADTDCLVIEVDMINTDIAGANLSFIWGSAKQELTEASSIKGFNLFTDGMMMYNCTYTFPKYNADNTQNAMWTGFARKALTTIYVHPDGSADFYQNGKLVCYAKAADMTDDMKVRNGYVGVCHSGGAGTLLTMNSFKIGTFAESEFAYDNAGDPKDSQTVPTSVQWIVNDSNPTKNGLSDVWFTNNTSDIVGWTTANNYFKAETTAGAIVSNVVIPEASSFIDKTVQMNATLDVVGLGTATAKFAFGNAYVGVAAKEGKNYLTLWDGETVVEEKEVALAKGNFYFRANGDKTVVATFNGVTVSGAVTSYAGAFGFNVTDGATKVSLDNIELEVAGAFEKLGGTTVVTDFETELNETEWYIGSNGIYGGEQGDGVLVEDGKVIFMNAMDGSMISTAQKYNNFELTFDLVNFLVEGEEDEDGNFVRTPSYFPGVAYGMAEKNTFFGGDIAEMIYISGTAVHAFKTEYVDGTNYHWLQKEHDINFFDFTKDTISFKLTAIDGDVTFSWYAKSTGALMYEVKLENQNTYGHISIQTTGVANTQGGNFDIDNIKVVNLDEVATYELVEKELEEVSHETFAKSYVAGAINLGDMTNKTASFEVVTDVEGFFMKEDGSYVYVCPEEAPAEPVVVTYKVTIDDWNVNGFNPVEGTVYTVEGTIEFTYVVDETIIPDDGSDVTPPSACGSSMGVGSMLSFAVMGIVAVLVKKSKKN